MPCARSRPRSSPPRRVRGALSALFPLHAPASSDSPTEAPSSLPCSSLPSPTSSRVHAEVMARGERWFGVPVEEDPHALEPALLGFTHGPRLLETLRCRGAA